MPLRLHPPTVTKHSKLCVCVRLMGIPLLKWIGFYLDVLSQTLPTYLSVRSVWVKQTWRAMSHYFSHPHSMTFCSVSAPTLMAVPVQSFNLFHLLKRLQVRSLFQPREIIIFYIIMMNIIFYCWQYSHIYELSGTNGSSVMIGFVIGVLLTLALFVMKHLCNR